MLASSGSYRRIYDSVATTSHPKHSITFFLKSGSRPLLLW
jgi:hypothetical protein